MIKRLLILFVILISASSIFGSVVFEKKTLDVNVKFNPSLPQLSNFNYVTCQIGTSCDFSFIYYNYDDDIERRFVEVNTLSQKFVK